MASAARGLAASPQPVIPFRTAHQQPLTAGQLARTLEDLVALGFIEKFQDEHNVTRYRPRLVAAKRSVA